MTTWLYRSEAKGIQGYVLGTSRMREIAGASALVDKLADDARAWIAARCPGASVIAAAAGGLQVLFADQATLARFASAWPMYCARTRPGLHVIQAWVAVQGGSPTEAERHALFERLEQDRVRPSPSLPEAGPLTERSGRTGIAAVSESHGMALQDAATRCKEAAKGDGRFDARLLDEGRTFARGSDEGEFDDGYIAVIHADGNNIGRRFKATASFEELTRLSRGLGAATTKATRRAIEHVVKLRARDRAWAGAGVPMRPVVLGGDDLTIITRAADALPFSRAFLKAFEEESASLGGDAMTASAGVAMVKLAFPFRAAYQLAEQLCKDAKRRARTQAATPDHAPTPAAIAFHRVTTAAVLDWKGICQRELSVDGESGRLAGGPWTLADGPRSLTGLRALASQIRDQAAPKGTLREWLTEVSRTQHGRPSRAAALWTRMLEIVERGDESGATRRSIEEALSGLGVTDGAWRSDRTTPVADALAWLAVDPEVALDAEVEA